MARPASVHLFLQNCLGHHFGGSTLMERTWYKLTIIQREKMCLLSFTAANQSETEPSMSIIPFLPCAIVRDIGHLMGIVQQSLCE